MPVVDQFSDPAFGSLHRQITQMPALEAYVKQAEIDPGQLNVLPDTAYAWPVMRKFPIHTPQHAAMSYAYSKLAEWLPDEVHANLKQALEVYEVPEAVFANEKVAEALADAGATYLLPALKLFPVDTVEQCKYAQALLVNSLAKLDIEHRATAAGNLVKRADALGIGKELRSEVLQLAGLTISNTKCAQEWLEARATRLPETQATYKRAYRALADGLSKHAEEVADREGLLKVASAIAELDEQTGLDRHYDRRLPDALRTVFNTKKLAGESVDCGGTHVSLAKLAQLPASFWEDLGGRELSDEIAPGGVVDVSKLATVVETLPLDLKVILKAQCR